MAGYSLSIWDAVSLVDRSWAEDTMEANIADLNTNELTAPYDEAEEEEGAYCDDNSAFDPLTHANTLAHTAHSDPRVYFLAVMKGHAEYMPDEWSNAAHSLLLVTGGS